MNKQKLTGKRTARAIISLEDVMNAAIANTIKDIGVSAPVNLDQVACRFPVVVAPETRLFLDAQSAIFRQSIAGLAGMILDEVVRETKRRHGL